MKGLLLTVLLALLLMVRLLFEKRAHPGTGCRPEVWFRGKQAIVLLDQSCSVDKHRLGDRMREIDTDIWHRLLLEMFA